MRILILALAASTAVSIAIAPLAAQTATPDAGATNGQVDFTKPVIRSTNFKTQFVDPSNVQPEATPPPAPAPVAPIRLLPQPEPTAATAKVKTKRKSVSRRSKRKRSAASSQKRWWEKTGNPAVFALRDCLETYVQGHGGLADAVSARHHISTAIDKPCRDEFDRMAGLLAKRFGEKRFRTLSAELLTSTLLPAVTAHQ